MEAQRLVEIITTAGYKARSYSGRGMFGERCVSVNLDRGEEPTFGNKMTDACEESEKEEVQSIIRHYSQDSMGMGVVLYWRGKKVTDEVKFPDEESEW